jgi:hypothetical protein
MRLGQQPARSGAAFLARADPELRCEVESLLAQPESARFLDRPALNEANTSEQRDAIVSMFTPGASLGPYASKANLAQAA